MATLFRSEHDALGCVEIPANALYGIHTARATANFPLSGLRLPAVLIRAYAEVKLACARTNLALGYLPTDIAQAIDTACREVIRGEHHDAIVVDAFQGGAGTSTNMNINEVLANRAGALLGHPYGAYVVHPLHHVNLHQSTNDTYPTALKVAMLHELKRLEPSIADLQTTLQHKEQEYQNILRLARTQLQDAVPMTAGMTFGAWAEAISRDRWRIFKCRERIKLVNLGGTAVGTGLGAPREYILRVTDALRSITGLKIARAENFIDATQNMDCFVEVSGMLKTCAVNLLKICSDIRLLASGPMAGLGELHIPTQQTGSSIMPGKINPVIPEAVSQAALRVMANDGLAGNVAALGNLELNQFMPLLAHCLLESLHMLNHAVVLLHQRCLAQASPVTDRCAEHLASGGALATVLVPAVGYETAEHITELARQQHISIPEAAATVLGVSVEDVASVLTPQRMRQLGYTDETYASLRINTVKS
ncbi:aspartate ammonia-lyase [Desulfovibrio inopinatus]|uniref:aspartate ammonia-lyase n=1 Tax=Desulfovibrio inopinatus TaxID=102109 RepID=UPI0005564006|nr:aspartate ammonia-lyase [Desulfovibrio inopinatus]